MKIIVPCDWKTVDLLTTKSADDFGEALRGFCFVGNDNEMGCYSTFDMNKRFKRVKTHGIIYKEAAENLYQDIKPTVYHYKLDEKDCYLDDGKFCEPYEIVIGWTWDGDGCLYIRFNNRKVINDDCKKSYGWEWINES